MRSERKHGLSTEQFPVSAYVRSSKNLKDLKDICPIEDTPKLVSAAILRTGGLDVVRKKA